ncbi:MIP/aquaporin family protein [Streptococcus oricebi]|uniref:Aquaporin n=1 Tax=Streptococcus oricebi TaxID=1547447 RepID=A0ABS5B621_9STRE|nr:MIP/aquaporin family protein [Streptococcus oricebi]MBP2624283.1 aquaporin [Streptococcus oricebi]
MKEILSEFLGTALLLLLGNGVVAGVVLPKTKNHQSGWIVITMGWGFAVAIAAFVAGTAGPAHLNPALSIALAVKGDLAWGRALTFIVAQFSGAILGQILVYLMFKPHYDVEEDAGNILGTFSTGPAIKNPVSNLLSEILGTFVLVLTIIAIGSYDMQPGLGTLAVSVLIIGVGLSLGGTTGYAINPARDLGPRILHQLLPIKAKGSGDWSYAWIPVFGPILGGLIAVLVWSLLNT